MVSSLLQPATPCARAADKRAGMDGKGKPTDMKSGIKFAIAVAVLIAAQIAAGVHAKAQSLEAFFKA
jgi:hypothetical protein